MVITEHALDKYAYANWRRKAWLHKSPAGPEAAANEDASVGFLTPLQFRAAVMPAVIVSVRGEAREGLRGVGHEPRRGRLGVLSAEVVRELRGVDGDVTRRVGEVVQPRAVGPGHGDHREAARGRGAEQQPRRTMARQQGAG